MSDVDVFRKKCRELSETEKQLIFNMKETGETLLRHLNIIEKALEPNNKGLREMAIAKTKLEEAIMWATKSITA